MTSELQEPVFIPPGAGKLLEFLSVQHKLTGEQTGGAYYIFESVFNPGVGNGLHVHSREDEFAYVLEGALEVRLQDHTRVLDAGGLAHLPKGIPHALRNPLDTPSRYLFMSIPAGLEECFNAFAAAWQAGSLDDATHRAISLEYGMEWLE